MAGSRRRRHLPGFADRSRGRLHPFLDRGAGAGNRSKYFAGQADLVLVAFDDATLGAELRYEPSRGGELFPHLYAPLDPTLALWAKPLPLRADGAHVFPDLDSMIYALLRPLLFALDPEIAHRAAIWALTVGLHAARTGARPETSPPRSRARFSESDRPCRWLRQERRGAGRGAGARLRLRRGRHRHAAAASRQSAAAHVPPAATTRPIINRLGFNNDGHDAVHARLARADAHGIVGVNLGANKDSADRVADYVLGVRRFADVADYLTINISSPNTPGLRDLQEKDALTRLLGAVAEARARLPKPLPFLVKIAPDLDDDALGGDRRRR